MLVIEPLCAEYEIPEGGAAEVTLADGCSHSIDIYEQQITIWNEGIEDALVEIRAEHFSSRLTS
ncbi:MAG: hypothetical protein AB7O49_20100 [Sphingomonadales bacterium]